MTRADMPNRGVEQSSGYPDVDAESQVRGIQSRRGESTEASHSESTTQEQSTGTGEASKDVVADSDKPAK